MHTEATNAQHPMCVTHAEYTRSDGPLGERRADSELRSLRRAVEGEDLTGGPSNGFFVLHCVGRVAYTPHERS